MSETKLTVDEKGRLGSAALVAIKTALENQYETALANAKQSQVMLAEQYEREKKASCMGYGFKLLLNLLAMVFLKVDHHFLDFHKDGPSQEMKEMNEQFVEKVKAAYAETFALLDRMIVKARNVEDAAVIVHDQMNQIAFGRRNAGVTLMNLAASLGLRLNDGVKDMLSSIRTDEKFNELIRVEVKNVLSTE